MPTRNHPRSALRAIVTATLAAAVLGLPASAIAHTAKEQELEKMVQQLLAEKKAAPAPAAAPAAAPAKPAGPAIQASSITPNAAPNTTFLLTGFVKVDANFTNTSDGELADSSIGRDFYVPSTIPIGEPQNDEGTDLNAHIKQSRVNFGTDTILEGGGKVSTRFEFDFYGRADGDQRISNGYDPVVRHAYVTWGNWLVGQTWSNFMDVATLPESVDFIGPTDGTTFVRQPQVRWTKGGLSLSAENRETTITPYTVNATTGVVTAGGRITSDDGMVPDLTARYAWKGKWGHVALAGMARELTHETATIDDSTWSGSLSLSGKFNIAKDDIRWMLLYGNLGRYVGLNFANDAILDPDGNIDSLDGVAGFVAYRHMWTDKLRSTLSYAFQDYDYDSILSDTTALSSSSSWTVNLFYSPLPKLDIGAEYRSATAERENGDDGDLDRFQLTTKYSF